MTQHLAWPGCGQDREAHVMAGQGGGLGTAAPGQSEARLADWTHSEFLGLTKTFCF